MGMLPEDIEHNTQYDMIDDEIKPYFRETLQETHEADYMIVTSQTEASQGKVKIILEQLSQLNMSDCYEIFTKPRRETEEDEETKKETVFISIKMPENLMNE